MQTLCNSMGWDAVWRKHKYRQYIQKRTLAIDQRLGDQLGLGYSKKALNFGLARGLVGLKGKGTWNLGPDLTSPHAGIVECLMNGRYNPDVGTATGMKP